MKIAKVFLNQKNKKIDKEFNYLVPDEAQIGQRVGVSFGIGSRKLEGVIVDFEEISSLNNLKSIDYILDKVPVLNKNQLKLARYLKNNYFQLFYECLSNSTASVKTYRTKKNIYRVKNDLIEPTYILNDVDTEIRVRGILQKRVLSALNNGNLTFSQLQELIPTLTINTINRLLDLGLIKEKFEDEDKHLTRIKLKQDLKKELNRKTSKNFMKINNLDFFIEFLNHIVDNSNGQTIIVFPNNQLATSFYNHYKESNPDCLLFKSSFKAKERFVRYKEISEGNRKVIIGTYPILFFNFFDLENILLTNVGDESYYSSLTNFFNVVDVAEKVAEYNHSNLLASDYIDSTLINYKVNYGDWNYQSDLSNDINFNDVNVVKIDSTSSDSILSPDLIKEINITLDNNQKVILVMNRKGYFNFFSCTNCNQPLKCPKCGSILKSTHNDKQVECRMCGFEASFPSECSNCSNPTFQKSSLGLEKIVEDLNILYPEKTITPYFKERKANLDNSDIIVTTKAILYHPTLENVGLVSILFSDLDLNYPDYNASESAYRFYSDLFLRYNNARKILQKNFGSKNFFEAFETSNEAPFILEQANYKSLVKVPPYYDIYKITLTAPDYKTANREVINLRNLFLEYLPEDYVLPYYNVREIKGTSQRRFIVKDDRTNDLTNIINSFYENGEIEKLISKVSIIKNPSNIN